MQENKEIKNWDGVEVEEVAINEVTEHIDASARSSTGPGVGFVHWFYCDG